MKDMRRLFVSTLLGLMSLHLGATVLLAHLRSEGPTTELRLTSTSGALVLFGKNSMDLTVYKLFQTWPELEAHLASEKLQLPRIVEVTQLPPSYISVEAIAPFENERNDGEFKILWSQNGGERFVIHTPDSRSAEVLRNYVYYHGLENSHLGFSIPISEMTP